MICFQIILADYASFCTHMKNDSSRLLFDVLDMEIESKSSLGDHFGERRLLAHDEVCLSFVVALVRLENYEQ